MPQPTRFINPDDATALRTFYLSLPSTPPCAASPEFPMPPNPPPRHWPWVAAVIGMALLATITLASSPDPPAGASGQPDEPPASSTSCHRHDRLCEHPLN